MMSLTEESIRSFFDAEDKCQKSGKVVDILRGEIPGTKLGLVVLTRSQNFWKWIARGFICTRFGLPDACPGLSFNLVLCASR